ncbi:MAG TPA: hypothetical protein VJS44_17530 [Pyrinomonadaceae bacterium]|nr:hypothetical protein [Pyrinomonadaceae bacterium]
MGTIDILLKAILALLGAILGAVFSYLYKRVTRLVKENRPLSKLYPFDRKSKVWIVLSEFEIKKEGEFFDKVSPIDGVYSFDDLADYLRKIGLSRQHFDTCFSSDLTDRYCEDNLILIGGYENNKVSKRMNDEHYKKRHFMIRGNKIMERGGEERIWDIGPEQLDEKGRIKKDFCLVTKMPNPFCADDDQRSWVVAFEGVREYGTWGAVRYWNEKIFDRFDEIGLKPKRGQKFELVVSINVNQDNDNLARRVEFGSIEAAYLEGEMKK